MTMSKYKNFTEAMKNVDNNDVLKSCYSLIYVAQQYATFLKRYETLYKFERIANLRYSDKTKDKTKDRTKELLYDYTILRCIKYIREEYEIEFNLSDFLNDYVISEEWYNQQKQSYLLLEEYPELNDEKIYEYITEELKRLNNEDLYDEENLEKDLNNLEPIVDNLLNNLKSKNVDQEEAFNMIYSEEFIKKIIELMENYRNENDKNIKDKIYAKITVIIIPAVRSTLCYKEMKGSACAKNFSKTFNYNLEQLKDKCDDKMNKYSKLIKDIQVIDKFFENLLNKKA